MVELADEELVLVSAETLVDHATEGLPIMRKITLHRLKPTSSSTDEVVGSNSNPNLMGNRVYFEVILGTRDPELRVVAIELMEIHLRKALKVEVVGKRGMGGISCECWKRRVVRIEWGLGGDGLNLIGMEKRSSGDGLQWTGMRDRSIELVRVCWKRSNRIGVGWTSNELLMNWWGN